MQFGDQTAIGGIRRRIRQGHASQRVEIAQARAGKLEAQIQRAQVLWVGQGPGDHRMGVTDLHVSLYRKRLTGILEREQTADLAGAAQLLTVVLTGDRQTECIVLRHCALVLGLFCFLAADDFTERDRLAEQVDHYVQIGVEFLVIEAHQPLVELDRADVHHPFGGLGIRIGLGQIEHPVGATIGQTLQTGLGAGQIDTRDNHLLSQQRQQRETKFDMLEGHHLRGLRPLRITQAQVIGDKVRRRHPGTPATEFGLARPAHIQVTIDGERAMQRFADFLIEGGFDAIPVESDNHNDQYGQHH